FIVLSHCQPTLLLSFPLPVPPVFHSLSLHDALPIYSSASLCMLMNTSPSACLSFNLTYSSFERVNFTLAPSSFNIFSNSLAVFRSEEHTSELQSRFDLVCRLLLEKKNTNIISAFHS